MNATSLLSRGLPPQKNPIWQSTLIAVLKNMTSPSLDLEPFENLLGVLSQIDI